MTGSFLKNLLGELSLDRALKQILDEPYLKDLASRFKSDDAVQEIFNKLDKEEKIFDWMDYDQMMDMRTKILPDLLIQQSGLQKPDPTIKTDIGSSFDEQFKSIYGDMFDDKEKFASGGGFKPKIKTSFIKNKIGEVIKEFSEKFGIEGPVFDENPQAYTRDIANWIRLNIGDEFFFHPQVKDSIQGTLKMLDQVDMGMEGGQKHYPDIMEIAMEKYPLYSGVDDDLSKLGIPQEDLRNALGSAYSTVNTFKEILNAMEKAKSFNKKFPPDDITKNARGGIMAFDNGGDFTPVGKGSGPYGDEYEYINMMVDGEKRNMPWNKLTDQQKEDWKNEIVERHTEEHYGDTPAWDVFGFTSEPDYIARPYKRYWNSEKGVYQKAPVTDKQKKNEAWLDKQRRVGGRLEPYGFDPLKFGKLLGLDEAAWYKGIGQSATPGTGGTAGFYGAVANPMETYIENWEDYAAETGHYPPMWQQLPAAMGLGIGGFELLRRGIVNKLPPGAQSAIKEMFPLSMDKAFGKGSLKNWKKSLYRNPKNILKMHVNPKFNKQIFQKGIQKLIPGLAAKFGVGSFAGPIGWLTAAGLSAYDIYKLYTWYKNNAVPAEGTEGTDMQGKSERDLDKEFWSKIVPQYE
tara:strand:+ start:601 stop:2487 length:1887 start_codon:yes stop_codon:yes gene_type:complete